MSVQKCVAAIHDLSGFGRCSLAVILPILSAAGIQACAVPTAVLSTHTGGFDGVVFKDMTDYIQPCLSHYKSLGIEFDAVYSGFLGSGAQIAHCLEFFAAYNKSLKVVDPVMGDGGRLYKTYTKELCKGIGELVKAADIITPNLTEASILLSEDYPHELNQDNAKRWLARLGERVGIAVMTGVQMADGRIANIGHDRENSSFWRIDCDYVPVSYPGTGDIFAAVLTASLLKGDSLPIAMDRATKFTQMAIKTTYSYGLEPRNGVMFEPVLHWLGENTALADYKRM